MRSLVLWLVFLSLVGCAPSSNSPTPSPTTNNSPIQSRETAIRLDEEFTLTVGQEAVIEGERLRVRFERGIQDQRCPENVACVWQGNAKIRLRLIKASESEGIVELNTARLHEPREDGTYPAIGAYLRYKVRLVGLTRGPNYEARLIVTRTE
jgi:hypothetical protein